MNQVYSGVLDASNGEPKILSKNGSAILENIPIWQGYIKHWDTQAVHARFLNQRDYETGHPILIVWPRTAPVEEPYIEFYYNERLVKYSASFFGHNAINSNGAIYNFSHLMNENEIMAPEEYFYRPALGEFAPSPDTGQFEIKPDGTAYFDKFGRNFMRTIHCVRIRGLDVTAFKHYLNHQLNVIHSTPPDPKEPEKYADFNFVFRSCATIIRDGFQECGLPEVSGNIPLDLFVSAAYHALKNTSLETEVFTMPQLHVIEAPPSVMTPILNPRNRWRYLYVKKHLS